MSVAQIIERMRAKMAAVDPNGPRTCSGIVQLNLGDQNWTMDLDALTLVEGTAPSANATFDMDNETFVAIGTRALSIDDAKASGRVQVSGDKDLLLALREVTKDD